MQAKIAAELATMIAEEAQIKAETSTQIAEDSVKSKQQFLSNMSHEIRTPMNAIIGFTKVVLKTKLTAKQKEYLQAIKMSGDTLIVLINDILDLSKVDSGKMNFEKTPFKLELSLSAMLHLFETKIQEKNLKLVKEYDKRIPEVLLGDSVRLHQIILNLVSNAVKFTAKGTITAKASLLKESAETVTIEFSVTDTGIGISENNLERIFENFQQASSGTSRLFGGTGLGLAISKQLVEQQGGEISVISEVDKGSTFKFVLTLQKTNELVKSEIEIEDENLEANTIKVLVVEDIALNQLLMKTLLDDFGFEKDIASNGKIAIEKLKHNVYDIILMDLQMPEMNGFEATEHIRKKMKSNIPIIALTADVTSADIDKCNAAGMNDYISKPVNDRLLLKKIIGLVKKPILINNLSINTAMDTKTKCTDLQYLMTRTKSNPDLMMEMISLYLEQTPPLISAMKISMENKDWETLQATVHKMIPSFSIVGIHAKFEDMAKKINEFAHTQLQTSDIDTMVLQLENVLSQACLELKEEFNNIKKSKDE
jgi:CheY-like chemotaxis protein